MPSHGTSDERRRRYISVIRRASVFAVPSASPLRNRIRGLALRRAAPASFRRERASGVRDLPPPSAAPARALMKDGLQLLAELFNDFLQVHDVFLDDASSLRFAGLFARAKLLVGWFAIILFRVRHHASRFSLCRPQCLSLREVLN